MRKIRIQILLPILLSLIFPLQLNAENSSSFKSGINYFQEKQYSDALLNFRDALLHEKNALESGNIYLWISKSYTKLREYNRAELNLLFFLENFQKHPAEEEILYLYIKVLYRQQKYNESIKVIYTFTSKFPNSGYYPENIFILGESLYQLSEYKKAESVLNQLIRNFPDHSIVNLIKYRLEIIKLKDREQSLVELLRWSHEESMQQILESLNKTENSNIKKSVAEELPKQWELKINDLNIKLAERDEKIKELEDILDKTRSDNPEIISILREKSRLEKEKELLAVKQEALNLLYYYITENQMKSSKNREVK